MRAEIEGMNEKLKDAVARLDMLIRCTQTISKGSALKAPMIREIDLIKKCLGEALEIIEYEDERKFRDHIESDFEKGMGSTR